MTNKPRIFGQPFEGNYPISQYFGENPSTYAQFGLPGHNGIDYATPSGTRAVSVIAGRVRKVGYQAGGWGHYVEVQDGNLVTIHAHFKEEPVVEVGDLVEVGDTLGYTGNTGFSFSNSGGAGYHLHFGVKILLPHDALVFAGKYSEYRGWVDPFDPEITEWVSPKNNDFSFDPESMNFNSELYKDIAEQVNACAIAIEQISDIQDGLNGLLSRLHARNNDFRSS